MVVPGHPELLLSSSGVSALGSPQGLAVLCWPQVPVGQWCPLGGACFPSPRGTPGWLPGDQPGYRLCVGGGVHSVGVCGMGGCWCEHVVCI